MTEAAPDRNHGDLTLMLHHSGIPVNSWGRANAKTVAHLQQELESGESRLVTTDSGELTRELRALAINIYYRQPENRWLRLVEASQKFNDGRQRIRHFSTSIGEKLLASEESGEESVMRALDEELGLSAASVASWEHIKDVEKTRESNSYPGLITHYLLHHYAVILNQSGYVAEGYVENSVDKSTRFIWTYADEEW